MSAREWQPGDVAMLGSSVALRVTYDPFGCPATHAHDGDHWHRATGDWVIDGGGIEPHPLVVIDPEDREQIERLIRALPDAADWGFLHDSLDDEGPADVVDGITEDFQAALREFANPTPPRPEEPTGKWAVVIAFGVTYVRAAWASDKPWSRVGTERFASWDELDVESVEFEGVQS